MSDSSRRIEWRRLGARNGWARGRYVRHAQRGNSVGRRLAERENGELVIHGEVGQIREKDSHGNDPRDIPG